MPLNLPSAYPGNPAGYVTYYKAQADNYSMSAVYARNPRETTTVLDWEMSSMLANCSRSIATKVYVADTGAWSTAANWYPTGVPAAGDNVLIGEGVSVTYDIDAPTTSISFVRLDGTLTHPHNASTALNVNTIFITPTGGHFIASEASPLSASRTCRIIFSSSTDMDASVDVALMTKGVVSAGTRRYFGAAKTHRLKVASNGGPAAGATGIVLEAAPTGWQVGDRITINGTRSAGQILQFDRYTPYQEETRTITAVGLSGTLSLDSALSYGHTAPSSTLVATNTMRAYVANLTRNIKFLTENGTTCLRHRRAHDMQMHYPTYTAKWVEWRDMGRTSKRHNMEGVVQNTSNASPNVNLINGFNSSNGTVSLSTEARIEIVYNGPPQNMVISGFDRSGTAISQTVALTGYYENVQLPYWTRITDVRLSSVVGTVNRINTFSTSMLATSLGLRNMNRSFASADWTYAPAYAPANVQGRYPVHFHKCGVDVDVFTSPIQMLGCVVTASPGWGFVHHLSHVNFIQCIAHDFTGSGFVAEAGNETGLWKDCHSTFGNSSFIDRTFKAVQERIDVDLAKNSAYWFTGRLIKVIGCVATDVEIAYNYNVRAEQTKLLKDQTDHPRALYGAPDPGIDEAPILHFKNNESIACFHGFILVKASQLQFHDVRTLLGPHLSWSCWVAGFEITYTQHYTMQDLTLVRGFAAAEGPAIFAGYTTHGFALGQNASDQTIIRAKVDGWATGIDLNHSNANDTAAGSVTANGRVVISPQFANCSASYGDLLSIDTILTEASLTSTITVSISLSIVGGVKYLPWRLNLGYKTNPSLDANYNGWRLGGEKRDGLYGQVGPKMNVYPGGVAAADTRDFPRMIWGWDVYYVKRYGCFTDSVLGLSMHFPVYYSDRATGRNYLKMVPATWNDNAAGWPATQGYNPTYVRGVADYTKTELPAVVTQRASLTMNTTINVNLLAGATHSLSISMYVASVDRPYNSHVVDNLNGTITIVPPLDFTGTETFSYWVADNNANVAEGQVIVTVLPVTGATGRAGVNDFIATQNNTAVSVNVLANDIGDSKALQTVTVVGGNAVGTASISTGGIIVFTPTSTYATVATQTATVQYTFTASGGSAGASLFVTVNPPATGRAGVADFNSTTYNVAVSTNVLANDVGDSKVLLTATVVGGNSVGTASISTGGIIVFTPTNTFARTITQVAEIQYTFTASGGSAGASLFVTVNAGPPLPVAVADFTSTTYNQAVSYNVLANDTGGTTKTVLTASVVGGNSVGTASISTGGVIVFTPSTTFATTLTQVAEIQYTFTTTGGSAAGSLFITVNAGPSQPAPPPTPTSPVATDGTAQAYIGRSNGIIVLRQAYDTNQEGIVQLNRAVRIDGAEGDVDFDPAGIMYVTPTTTGRMRVSYRVINLANLTAEAIYYVDCVAAPRVGGNDGGSPPQIGAPISWSRKSISNIKSVAKAISAVFADLDPNDPIRLAERMVRKYSYPEIKKLIGTEDFDSLLDMELAELVEEMERLKNGG